MRYLFRLSDARLGVQLRRRSCENKKSQQALLICLHLQKRKHGLLCLKHLEHMPPNLAFLHERYRPDHGIRHAQMNCAPEKSTSIRAVTFGFHCSRGPKRLNAEVSFFFYRVLACSPNFRWRVEYAHGLEEEGVNSFLVE